MSTPFAISQLAKKLKLEANVSPKLTRFFREISRSIKPVLRVTGQVPSLNSFRDDLIEILTKHYVKVSKEFKGDAVTTLTKDAGIEIETKQDTIEDAAEETSGVVNEALAAIIALRAPRQADLILATTENELRQSMEKVSIEAAKEGERLTLAEQGRRAAKDFNNKIPGRVDSIAENETGVMAEVSKSIQAELISSKASLVVIKMWNSILDTVTRSFHATVDRQKRPEREPFNVKGQLLMRPKDMSLGATLDNVMGCRCSASYHVQGSSALSEKPVSEPAPKPRATAKPKPTPKPPTPRLEPTAKNSPRLATKKQLKKKPVSVKKESVPVTKLSGKLTSGEDSYVSWYSGDGFRQLNDFSRNPSSYSKAQSDELIKFRNSLNSAINKSTITKDTVLHRGVDAPEFKKMLVDGSIKNLGTPSFQSVSTSAEIAKTYSGFDGVMLNINVKKGTKVLDLNKGMLARNKIEQEMLLPDRGEMIVRSMREQEVVPGINRLVVEVDYVQ